MRSSSDCRSGWGYAGKPRWRAEVSRPSRSQRTTGSSTRVVTSGSDTNLMCPAQDDCSGEGGVGQPGASYSADELEWSVAGADPGSNVTAFPTLCARWHQWQQGQLRLLELVIRRAPCRTTLPVVGEEIPFRQKLSLETWRNRRWTW